MYRSYVSVIRVQSSEYRSCRIGVYFEVAHRIVVYRHVSVCILKYHIVLSCNGVYFEVSYRIVVYRQRKKERKKVKRKRKKEKRRRRKKKLSVSNTSLTGIGLAIPVSRPIHDNTM